LEKLGLAQSINLSEVEYLPANPCIMKHTDPSSELKSVAETFPSEFSFALAMNELEERE
jgi:hypothetical protein